MNSLNKRLVVMNIIRWPVIGIHETARLSPANSVVKRIRHIQIGIANKSVVILFDILFNIYILLFFKTILI